MWYALTLSLGIILLLVSLMILRETLAFLKQSEKSIATVIDLKKVEDSEGITYKPIFKFTTHKDQEFVYSYPVSGPNNTWYIGEEAVIVYDPSNPSVARIYNYFGLFSWSIILMAIAMPLIVIGAGYYLSQSILK